MASKGFAVLDVQNDEDELHSLSFQDFGDSNTVPANDRYEQTISFSDFPDSAQDEQEQKLLDSEDEQPKKSSYSLWSFEFYQQLFDVDSKHVGDRIIWSMVPKPGTSYLQTYIRPNPDLYGPFWICLTLVFTTAISGNVSNYLSSAAQAYKWKYDFHKVTFAASAIYAYAWLVPITVWGVLLWRKSKSNISLLELLCLYGYSLAIFVPVSILWVIPQPWFRFCLAIVAPILSGSVLVRTVWPALSHDSKQIAIILAVIIMVLHATLALGFMLYFFNAPNAQNRHDNKAVSVAAATTVPVKLEDTEGSKVVKSLSKDEQLGTRSINDKGSGTRLHIKSNNEANDKGSSTISDLKSNNSANDKSINTISDEKSNDAANDKGSGTKLDIKSSSVRNNDVGEKVVQNQEPITTAVKEVKDTVSSSNTPLKLSKNNTN